MLEQILEKFQKDGLLDLYGVRLEEGRGLYAAAEDGQMRRVTDKELGSCFDLDFYGYVEKPFHETDLRYSASHTNKYTFDNSASYFVDEELEAA